MKYDDWVLVIPSIRHINLDYIKGIPPEMMILVVDDSNGKIKPNRENMKVFYYRDQKRIMGQNYDLIPHKTAACRNFAFYYIWSETDYKYIISIDDDCITSDTFVLDYQQVLGRTKCIDTLEANGWVNTIDLLKCNSYSGKIMYARGFPYWEREKKRLIKTQTTTRIVCHTGLWSRYLDIDGLDKFIFDECSATYEDVTLLHDYVRIGTSKIPSKFPFSAMNFGFTRDFLPAVYQTPMMKTVVPGYFIWRFDDIWTGYVMQTLVHKRDEGMTVGKPLVIHSKEGNLKREIHGEHMGHLISPYFYQLIDEAAVEVQKDTYGAMLAELFLYAEIKLNTMDHIPKHYARFLRKIFKKFQRWSILFR